MLIGYTLSFILSLPFQLQNDFQERRTLVQNILAVHGQNIITGKAVWCVFILLSFVVRQCHFDMCISRSDSGVRWCPTILHGAGCSWSSLGIPYVLSRGKTSFLECPIAHRIGHQFSMNVFFACSSRFLVMLRLLLREASVCFSSSNEKQARSRTSCCLGTSVTLKNCLNQIHYHLVLVPRLLAVL